MQKNYNIRVHYDCESILLTLFSTKKSSAMKKAHSMALDYKNTIQLNYLSVADHLGNLKSKLEALLGIKPGIAVCLVILQQMLV